MKYLKLIGFSLLMAVAFTKPAAAIVFTVETTFQAAAGSSVPEETFESFDINDPVDSLPALGVAFETFASTGLFPLVTRPSIIGGTAVFGNVLMNNDTASLPADGPIVIVADAGTVITALGYFNTSVDDKTIVSFFDSNDDVLETADSGDGRSPIPFIGIVNASGAAKVSIRAFGDANDFISIDNLQIATAAISNSGGNPVPEPGTLALFGFGLAALGLARRQKRRK